MDSKMSFYNLPFLVVRTIERDFEHIIMNKELRNLTINNFYFSKLQRPGSQQSHQRSQKDQQNLQLSVLNKGSDRKYLKINSIVNKKPTF
jgi:hypothetical protein